MSLNPFHPIFLSSRPSVSLWLRFKSTYLYIHSSLFSSNSNQQNSVASALPSSSSTFNDPLSPDTCYSDIDSVLESRLRALNPSSAPLGSARSTGLEKDTPSTNLHSLLGSNFLQDFKDSAAKDDHEEVQNLLKSTFREVEIEKKQAKSDLGPGERLFGRVEDIESDQEDAEDNDELEVDKRTEESEDEEDEAFDYMAETNRLRKEADELVQTVRDQVPSTPEVASSFTAPNDPEPVINDPQISTSTPSAQINSKPQSSLLVLEPKERPTFSRSSTISNLALEDELANAMLEDLEPFKTIPRSPTKGRSDVSRGSQSAHDSMSDLAARFSKLQSNIKSPLIKKPAPVQSDQSAKAELSKSSVYLPSVPTSFASSPDSISSTKVSTSNVHINKLNEDEDSDESAPFSSLPSAPTSDPTFNSSGGGDDHSDLANVDLTPFSKLVKLSANSLEPGSFEATSQARLQNLKKEESEEEENPDDWCVICNEDSSIKCKGCDYDPYCSSCWAEGHENMGREEIREHGTVEFDGGKRGKKGGGKKKGGGSGKKLLTA